MNKNSKGNRVAVIAGARTPFVKSGKQFKDLGPLRLAREVVSGLIERHDVDSQSIEAISFGAVVPEHGTPNLAREIVLSAGLSNSIEAQTISSYCISGLRAITSIADAIAVGRIEAGIAGGVESLSHADPGIFREPSTGLSMGEHMELTREQWNISRKQQDQIALASHRNAIAAHDHLTDQIIPVNCVIGDTGPRANTSPDALSSLKAVFENSGTITAGNASPITDGASAVLLMSEERARREARTPLAFIRAMEYGAIDPGEGLLMAPAIVVPRLLKRVGVGLEQIELIEIHEAFAAQVLANAMAWEQGWKADPLEPINWDRVNVNGSSIALGHPWAATGGRIVTSLSYEMARRDARYGLVSICAAGAMAGALLLER